MKKTAVEWFYQRILSKDIKAVFEKAKEMEKEQICEAYAIGGSPLLGPWEFGEEYYNNTFKSE